MKTAPSLITPGGQMSDKEKLMLTMLVYGFNCRKIAESLGISTHYVYYLSRLLKARFAADTHAAVVSKAIAEGIISAEGQLLPQQTKND